MAEVVGEAQGLGQILVEPERPGDRPADLRDFEAVGEPDPEMVAVGRDEHLGLVAQAAEGDRMDDPVAVALVDVARAARALNRFRHEVGRATSRVWRRALRRASFRAEWHNLIGFGIGPAKGVDADGLEILGENLCVGRAAERPDHKAGTIGISRDIALDPIEQVAAARLDALELRRQGRGVRPARQLQPDLARRG